MIEKNCIDYYYCLVVEGIYSCPSKSTERKAKVKEWKVKGHSSCKKGMI